MYSNNLYCRTTYSVFVVLVVSLLHIGVGCKPDSPPTEQTNQAPQANEAQQEHPDAEEPPEKSAAEKVAEFTKEELAVIRAVREIPAGAPVTHDMVTYEQVPKRFLPPNPLLKDEFDIYEGQPVAEDIAEGAMILTSDFEVTKVTENLSDRVPPGERAFPLRFANISDVCDVLLPGDRLDILGALPVDSDGKFFPSSAAATPANVVSMTILQNVTLLAVGSKVSGQRSGEGAADCAGAKTVTVAVTKEEAEVLSAANASGELLLMVRNPEDVAVESVERRTLNEALEAVEELNEDRKERMKKRRTRAPRRSDQIQIIRGSD